MYNRPVWISWRMVITELFDIYSITTVVLLRDSWLLGYDVHLVADAVSSRSLVDRAFGIERMKKSGAFVTTCESVLFELLSDSKHPSFKQVQGLIKDPCPDTGLLTHKL